MSWCTKQIVGILSVISFASFPAQAQPPDAPPGESGAPEENEPSSTPAPESEKFDTTSGSALDIRRTENAKASSEVLTILDPDSILETHLVLSDYLALVPGFENNVRYSWYRWPSLRGVQGAVNFMIDGVGLTSPLDYRFEAGGGLFLEEFERVELTTGPAGVKWGAFSLLGTINLVSTGDWELGSEFRVGAGGPAFTTLSASHVLEIGQGFLKLFAAYRQMGHFQRNPSQTWVAVPPSGDEWRQVDAGNLQVEAPTDRFAVVSANYKSEHVRFYLRVPVSDTYFSVSELGAALPSGESGNRRVTDAMGYLAYQDAWRGGRISLFARGSWYLMRESFDRPLLASSAQLPGGSRIQTDITASRGEAMLESTYRAQANFLESATLLGAQLTLEVPHTSSAALSDPLLPGTTLRVGKSLENDPIVSISPYAFQEFRLWNRINLAGGLRYNYAGDTYKDVVLTQGSVGLRVVGESYVKFGITEGMRPPQLPDRAGVTPVQKAFLSPEESQALTLEVNSTVKDVGPFRLLTGRVTLAQTATSNNIIREGFIFEQSQAPVNSAGLEIRSLEATTEMKIAPASAQLSLSYRINEVRDKRAQGSASDKAAAILENPLCGTSDCPNRGPRHRFAILAAADVGPWARLSTTTALQCGGARVVAIGDADGSRPELATREDGRSVGCFASASVGAGFPAEKEGFGVDIRAENIVRNMPPPNFFSRAEFSGAEPGQRLERVSRFYILLSWSRSAQSW